MERGIILDGSVITGVITERPLRAQLAMSRADLVKLPVHAGRVSIVNLHPVDADVAGPRLGVARVHICQRDETSAVFRPAFEDRQIFQGKISIFHAMDDFLTRRIVYGSWARMQEMNSLFEQVQAFEKR